MEKVLIIGNLGYIGPVLEKKLNGKFEIHGYDIGYFSNDPRRKNFSKAKQYALLSKKFSEEAELDAIKKSLDN